MGEDYSFEELLGFLDYAADRGLLKRNTANGLKTAASKIEKDLLAEEAADVRSVDLDVLFQRFVNRNRVKVKPETLQIYKRRLATAISEFLRWRKDPVGYRPTVRGASSGDKGRPRVRKSGPVDPSKSDAEEASDQPRVSSQAPGPGVLTLPFPLRPDFLVTVQIPRDLKAHEAERLAAFLKTLVTEPGVPSREN